GTDREPDSYGWNIGSGASRQVSQDSPVVPAPYTPPPLSAPLPQQPAEQRLVAPVATPEPARVKAYADETMELPIFRELESAWFRSREPGADTGLTQSQPVASAAPAAPPVAPPRPAAVPQPASRPAVPQPAAPPP